MLRLKPCIFRASPRPIFLLRVACLQPQPLRLKQSSKHTSDLLVRHQSPAEISVKRAGDFAHGFGVGRVSPFWPDVPPGQILLQTGLVAVPECVVAFGCADVCGFDAGCAAVGFQKRGLQYAL